MFYSLFRLVDVSVCSGNSVDYRQERDPIVYGFCLVFTFYNMFPPYQSLTVGCETVDMTLRRNGLGQLGFHVRLDGTVAEVLSDDHLPHHIFY